MTPTTPAQTQLGQSLLGRASRTAQALGSEPRELSDDEIVALAQLGDASAFEAIYHRHSPRVYAVCLRMVGNTAEAEDLTQEAFMQVLRKINTFRGDSAFSTWLHRIAVNLTLMRMRRGRPARETSLDDATAQFGDAAYPQNQFAQPDRHLASSLDRLNLQRALGQLRPSQKLVVELHDIQGYKHYEIAKMLDWTVGNSKSQLHRARTRLRKALRESFGFTALNSSRPPRPAFSA